MRRTPGIWTAAVLCTTDKVYRGGCGVQFRDYLGIDSTRWDFGLASRTRSLDGVFKIRKGQEAFIPTTGMALQWPVSIGPFTQKRASYQPYKAIKNKQEILNLLEALWLPKISYYIYIAWATRRLLHLRPGANREQT